MGEDFVSNPGPPSRSSTRYIRTGLKVRGIFSPPFPYVARLPFKPCQGFPESRDPTSASDRRELRRDVHREPRVRFKKIPTLGSHWVSLAIHYENDLLDAEPACEAIEDRHR